MYEPPQKPAISWEWHNPNFNRFILRRTPPLRTRLWCGRRPASSRWQSCSRAFRHVTFKLGKLAKLLAMSAEGDYRSGETVAGDISHDTRLSDLIRATEVANIFQCARRTIDRWVERGVLSPVKIGGSVYFQTDEVRRLIEDGINASVLKSAQRRVLRANSKHAQNNKSDQSLEQ